MKATSSIGVWLAKVALIALAFFACFAATIPVVTLMIRLFPAAPFLVQVFPVIPIMMAANRFALSPLEYHLNVKSLQYDPWYERRRARLLSRS